jgi:preprotein translocase subunit SecE
LWVVEDRVMRRIFWPKREEPSRIV